jgi:hypothetical protein
MHHSMEKILNLKNLNRRLFKTTILFVLLLPSYLFAQENTWQHIQTIKVPKVSKVSLDRYDLIYIADDRGNVHQIDSSGNLMLTFSPKRNSEVALLEAWRKVNVIAFYRNFQEYVLLDRFLTSSPNLKLKHDLVGFASLVTYSADNNLWIIDEKDFSLKKYNVKFNSIDAHTPLDLILSHKTYEMTYMREYQNLLFISDRSAGIILFDNLGNFKTKIPFRNLSYFNFLGDELYFLSNDEITFYNIYTKKERKFRIPDGKKFEYVLFIKDKAYFFLNDSMEIYLTNF